MTPSTVCSEVFDSLISSSSSSPFTTTGLFVDPWCANKGWLHRNPDPHRGGLSQQHHMPGLLQVKKSPYIFHSGSLPSFPFSTGIFFFLRNSSLFLNLFFFSLVLCPLMSSALVIVSWSTSFADCILLRFHFFEFTLFVLDTPSHPVHTMWHYIRKKEGIRNCNTPQCSRCMAGDAMMLMTRQQLLHDDAFWY